MLPNMLYPDYPAISYPFISIMQPCFLSEIQMNPIPPFFAPKYLYLLLNEFSRGKGLLMHLMLAAPAPPPSSSGSGRGPLEASAADVGEEPQIPVGYVRS